MFSQAGSVFSCMAVHHLAKHCKYHKLCCFPGAECRCSAQEPGPGTHTDSAISVLIFTEEGSESHCSGSHTALWQLSVTHRGVGTGLQHWWGWEGAGASRRWHKPRDSRSCHPPAAPFAFCYEGLFCCCSASLVPVLTWNDGPCRENSALEKSGKNTQARQSVADYHSWFLEREELLHMPELL